jgi:hypothetical protein
LASKPKRNSTPFQPLSLWFYPFLFLSTFGIYTSTLNPALFRNDSPETITACFTLGVSHPPGYPLHSLLGRLFSFLRVGNPAMTINFFSAFLGAVGVCLFAVNLWVFLSSLKRLRDNDLHQYKIIFASGIGSFCFAFSKSYWSLSLAAKGGIYTFQVVLELGLLLYFQYWNQKRSSFQSQYQCFYFFTFIFSLGLINHWPSLMLLVPAIIVVALAHPDLPRADQRLEWKQGLTCLSIMLIVLSLYLYLPLRSHLSPALNFGSSSSFKNLFNSIFRINYFNRETLVSFAPTAAATIQNKSIYISNRFENEFNVFFSLFVFLGIYFFWRRALRKELLFLLLVLLTTTIANILYLQVSPIEYWHLDDHLVTDNWVTALLASVGIYSLLTSANNRSLFKYILPILLITLPFLTFRKNIVADDQRREFLYWGYGIEALKSMDLNADYFAESDYDYFSILYLRDVEHKREDMGLTLTSFMSEKDWQDVLELAATQPYDSRPKYCAFPNGGFIDGYLEHAPTASFKPDGTIVQFMPPAKMLNRLPNQKPLEDLWQRYLNTDCRSSNPINGLLLEICAHPYLHMADYLKLRGDLREWDSFYEKALSLIQDPKWSAETSAAKAEGDLALRDKTTVLVDYLFAFQQYKKAGMSIEAEEMWQKILAMQPSVPWAVHTK